jgi:hypothetical protein
MHAEGAGTGEDGTPRHRRIFTRFHGRHEYCVALLLLVGRHQIPDLLADQLPAVARVNRPGQAIGAGNGSMSIDLNIGDGQLIERVELTIDPNRFNSPRALVHFFTFFCCLRAIVCRDLRRT